MDKAELKARIRAIEPALRRGGLEELGLFGSFARGDQTPESDVDLLYTFENGQASLKRLVDLGTLLEETLGHRVDLVSRAFLHPAFREEVLAEREPIFEPLPASAQSTGSDINFTPWRNSSSSSARPASRCPARPSSAVANTAGGTASKPCGSNPTTNGARG